MSPRKLFFKRLLSEWKLQYRAWKTAVDWTVAFYFILPAFAFGIYQYSLCWTNPSPWLNAVPLEMMLLLCFLFAWSGSIRIFIEEGDQLFLVRCEKWRRHLMALGMSYSFGVFLFQNILFFLLFAPFLVLHFQLTATHFIGLFAVTLLLKIFLGLAKQLLSLRFAGWKKFFVLKGTFFLGTLLSVLLLPRILSSSIVFWAVVTVLFMASVLLIVKRLDLKGCFFADVEREQESRLKYVSFLLSVSGIKTKKPKRKRVRPWLFRRSNPLFSRQDPGNKLVELCIKATLRNPQRMWMYSQMVLVSVLLVIGWHSSLKWLIWLALAFILTNYVGMDWIEIMGAV